MTESLDYRLHINGTDHAVEDAWVGESLLFVLRERLGLPGAKNACEQGECGSCSVYVDGGDRAALDDQAVAHRAASRTASRIFS